jgi:hypothetical protein
MLDDGTASGRADGGWPAIVSPLAPSCLSGGRARSVAPADLQTHLKSRQPPVATGGSRENEWRRPRGPRPTRNRVVPPASRTNRWQRPPAHTPTQNRTSHPSQQVGRATTGGRGRQSPHPPEIASLPDLKQKQVAVTASAHTHPKSRQPLVTTGGSRENEWRKPRVHRPTRNRGVPPDLTHKQVAEAASPHTHPKIAPATRRDKWVTQQQVAEAASPHTHPKSRQPPVAASGSRNNKWRKPPAHTPTRNRTSHPSQQVCHAKTSGGVVSGGRRGG